MMTILNITYADKKYYNGHSFLPISAGSLNSNIQSDNTGDNISEKNPRYGELTAVYWAWKNLKNVDIIGMSHYRRFLMTRSSGFVKTHYDITWENFLDLNYNPKVFETDLKKYDFVVSKKWHFEGKTIESQYLEHHPFPEDLQLLRSILLDLHLEAVPFYDEYLKGSDTYTCCLFVTSWEQFDKLCSWMFPVLFELEKRLDFSKYNVYQQRMIAFLYERLLNVYFKLGNYQMKEYPFYFIDNSCTKTIARQNLGAIAWTLIQKLRLNNIKNVTI